MKKYIYIGANLTKCHLTWAESTKKECHLISTIDVKINKIGKYTENREIW